MLSGLLKSAWRRSVTQLVFHRFCNCSMSVTGYDFQKLNLSKLFSLGDTSAAIRNWHLSPARGHWAEEAARLSTMPEQ